MKQLFVVTRTQGRAWHATKPINAQAQWPEHTTFMNRLAADGFVVLGGPLGDSGDLLLIVDAADANEIKATPARDPWSQSGILDVKEIQLGQYFSRPRKSSVFRFLTSDF